MFNSTGVILFSTRVRSRVMSHNTRWSQISIWLKYSPIFGHFQYLNVFQREATFLFSHLWQLRHSSLTTSADFQFKLENLIFHRLAYAAWRTTPDSLFIWDRLRSGWQLLHGSSILLMSATSTSTSSSSATSTPLSSSNSTSSTSLPSLNSTSSTSLPTAFSNSTSSTS